MTGQTPLTGQSKRCHEQFTIGMIKCWPCGVDREKPGFQKSLQKNVSMLPGKSRQKVPLKCMFTNQRELLKLETEKQGRI